MSKEITGNLVNINVHSTVLLLKSTAVIDHEKFKRRTAILLRGVQRKSQSKAHGKVHKKYILVELTNMSHK